MHTRFIPRLLVVALSLVFVVTGVIAGPAFTASAKAEMTDWAETNSEENVLVQACDGFDVTSSYTANLNHHLITDNTGDEVLGRLNVDFAGAIGNSETGKSYVYDGHFTRWSDYVHGRVTINDLELRFEVNTPGEFTVAVDHIDLDLVADPTAVIKTFVPNALQMELCYLLAGPASGSSPQAVNIHTENSALPSISEIVYGENSVSIPSTDEQAESSVLIPPASYESGDNADTCQPRRGYSQDC